MWIPLADKEITWGGLFVSDDHLEDWSVHLSSWIFLKYTNKLSFEREYFGKLKIINL